MNRKLKIAIPVLLLALVVAAIAMGFGWLGKEDESVLGFSGNIEMTEVSISFKSPGRVAELKLREGDRVAKGDVIARLDTETLERQRERILATLEGSKSRLLQTGTSLDVQTQTAEGQLDQRRAELRGAQAALAELQAGTRSQDIEQASAGLDRARAEHATAEREWQRAETLFAKEDISASAHDQAKVRLDSAAAGLRQAEERLALLKEGPRAETIEAARAQVERAQAGVKLAGAAKLDVKRVQQEIEVRHAEIAQIQAELRVIDSQLNDAVLRAPIDGVVMVRSVEEGEVVAAGTTVLSLADVGHPWVRGYIPEADLGRVKLGSAVGVSTDSFPGKTYQGRISFIASEAEFTPKQIQTREERVKLVYRIKVEVDNRDGELKLNMPVDAQIVLNGK